MNRVLANIILPAIMCIAFFLLLANLGNQYLWQDEAETAMVSKTIFQYGVPHGYDGKNFFSQMVGQDYTKNYIWVRHMWLPYYILAGFFKVFGTSTFVSRLPFAIFGFAGMIMTYCFAHSFLKNQRTAIFAALMLSLCVSFLLLARQCRYYSVAIFFSMLSLYAYQMLLEKKKYAGIALFISGTLLFHSQHIYIFILVGSVFLHTIIFHRDRCKSVLLVLLALIIVNGPWVIWLMKMNSVLNKVMPTSMAINWLVSDIVQYAFPAWLVLIALFVLVIRKIKGGKFFEDKQLLIDKLSLLIFFVILNIVMILIISPFPFFRYLGPSIPLLIILMAMIIESVWRLNKAAAIAIIIIIVSTSNLRHYIYEITHDFDGPAEGICKYLNEHGADDDIVAITYGDMPLKFYTKMRVVGGLTGEKLESAKNAKWVIMRRYSNSDKDKKVKLFLQRNVDFTKYRPVTIDYPDTPFENREYLGKHYFRTQNHEDRVVIYERIN